MLAGPSEEQQNLYRLAFVENCFALVVRAYSVIDTRSFKSAEEPDITGELVRLAKTLIESNEAEPWLDHIEVLDDPPQTLVGRLGKRRPRIDIEIVRTGRGKLPRFHIEAKRLYRTDSVSEYLGPSGPQMFIRGEYAGSWPSAGMLGYVQSEGCTSWLRRLASGFESRRVELRICGDLPGWAPTGWRGAGLDLAQTSCHERTSQDLDRVRIFHLLLEFT
jgi:hypothetical protein